MVNGQWKPLMHGAGKGRVIRGGRYDLSSPAFNREGSIIDYTNHRNMFRPALYINGGYLEDDLYSKTFVWLGDSLMTGANETEGKAFPEYFEKLTGATIYNVAVGGSTITDNTDENIMHQVNLAIAGATQNKVKVDYIILDGGGIDAMGYELPFITTPKKEVGQVDMSSNNVTPGDSVINDFEEIIYKLKQNFPEAKILYVQPFKGDREQFENIVYVFATTYYSLEELNAKLGTNASSYEELKPKIIEIFTNGNAELDVAPIIPNMDTRFNEIINQIQKAAQKYSIQYLDISQYVNLAEDLQYDNVHFNEHGYTKLTPYIVDKIKSMK